MTDSELFEIVKDHREAWPYHIVYGELDGFGVRDTQEVCGHGDTRPRRIDARTALLAFEAAFHRAILDRVWAQVDKWPDGYVVRLSSGDFDSPRLIEAYAKALEWLK